jgi:NAD(P)-dependent dehydrogenase (short-subunit alcohol dehydrogenase family)
VAERIVGMGRSVPMGWMGGGEDVANAVVWLCSGASRYVTSQAVVVDGGLRRVQGWEVGVGFEGRRAWFGG